MAEHGGTVQAAIAELGLGRIDDLEAVRAEVRQVLEEQPKALADLRAGKQQVMGFLVGQVMRRTRGRVAPDVASRLITEEVGQ
jgi:aspartyl-tRNA(Asn)/glutamyl-tRNA(Gln) amidotransferase subunit B